MKKLILIPFLLFILNSHAQTTVEAGSILQTTNQAYIKNQTDSVNSRIYQYFGTGKYAYRIPRWQDLLKYFLKPNGSTSQYIRGDGSLASFPIFSFLPKANNGLTVTADSTVQLGGNYFTTIPIVSTNGSVLGIVSSDAGGNQGGISVSSNGSTVQSSDLAGTVYGIQNTPTGASIGRISSAGNQYQQIVFGTNLIRVDDILSSKGLVYGANYFTNGSMDDRWIPDWGAVKSLDANVVHKAGVENITGIKTFLTDVYITNGNLYMNSNLFVRGFAVFNEQENNLRYLQLGGGILTGQTQLTVAPVSPNDLVRLTDLTSGGTVDSTIIANTYLKKPTITESNSYKRLVLDSATNSVAKLNVQASETLYQKLLTGHAVTFASEGTSLTYGQNTYTGTNPGINGSTITRNDNPPPESLQSVFTTLGLSATVTNRGFPGDRTNDGITRWASAPATDVVFLEYGTNDANNYGNRPGGIVPIPEFKKNYRLLIERRLNQGSWVILVIPPHIGTASTDAKLDKYISCIYELAHEFGCPVYDLQQQIKWVNDSNYWLPDNVHLINDADADWGSNMASFILNRSINIIKAAPGDSFSPESQIVPSSLARLTYASSTYGTLQQIPASGTTSITLDIKQRCKMWVNTVSAVGSGTRTLKFSYGIGVSASDITVANTATVNTPVRSELFILEPGLRTITVTNMSSTLVGYIDAIGFADAPMITQQMIPLTDNTYGIGDNSHTYNGVFTKTISGNGSLSITATSALSLIGVGGVSNVRLFGNTGNSVFQNGGTITDAGYKVDIPSTGSAGYWRAGNVNIGSTGTLNAGLILPFADNTYNLGASSLAYSTVFTKQVSSNGSLNVIFPTNLSLLGTSNTVYGRMFGATGNLVLQNGGTIIDGGYRFDVQGTLRTTGVNTLANLSTAGIVTNTASGVLGTTATIPVANGGTEQSTYTTGDLLYSSATNTLAKRAIGSTNQVLTVVGGVPTWATPSAGFTNPMTTLGDVIYGATAGTATRLAGNTTTARQFLTSTGNGTISAAPSYFDLFDGVNTWTGQNTFIFGSFVKLGGKTTYLGTNNINGVSLFADDSGANNYDVHIQAKAGTLALLSDITTATDNILSKTANYTIVAGDFVTGKKTTLDLYVDATAGNVTITMPSAATFAGYTIYVTKTDVSVNTVTINTVLGGNTLLTQYQSRHFSNNSSSWFNH